MKFTETARNLRLDLLYLIQGDAYGDAAWHYLLVDKNKLPLLKHALKNEGDLKVSLYGEILASGWGKSPPDEVTEEVRRRFNIN